MSVWGVGIIGAGPVTQAIHVPTLARLAETYRITRVFDIDADTAKIVADRAGANTCTSVEELLGAEDVDVVLIATPDRFHAEQVLAAARAGIRGVLCEKPLATSAVEADAVADAARSFGTHLVVGAMHVYDRGWIEGLKAVPDVDAFHTIRSSIVIPPNSRMQDEASSLVRQTQMPDFDLHDLDTRVMLLRLGVLGLAVHDLPLIRKLTSAGSVADLEVMHAEPRLPFGYRIVVLVDGKRVELDGLSSNNWEATWTLSAHSDRSSLHVRFSPSFVHAGSARSVVTTESGEHVFGRYEKNGYETEWEHLDAELRGEGVDVPADPVADVRFAIALADAVEAHHRQQGVAA